MKSEHRVLTPESVEFVYELAGLGSRMAAVAIDHLLLVGLLLAFWTISCVTGVMTILLLGPVIGVAVFATFCLYFGYFAYFEWKWNGQTPGKRLMDLRVIDDRGMNIDLVQALLRNLFRAADMLPFLVSLDFVAIGFYGIGGICALLNPRQKRLGDWAAGTLVVRTRKRVIPNAVIAPNEKYNSLQEDGALRARIRAKLSLEDRETLLQLSLRRNELELEARHSLFASAAEYLEEKLEIQREPFLSEEKFVQNIAAVALAEAETRGRGMAGALGR